MPVLHELEGIVLGILPINDFDDTLLVLLTCTIIPWQAIEHVPASHIEGIEGVERMVVVGVVQVTTP